jgi:uncharacterized protein YchJ
VQSRRGPTENQLDKCQIFQKTFPELHVEVVKVHEETLLYFSFVEFGAKMQQEQQQQHLADETGHALSILGMAFWHFTDKQVDLRGF